MIVVEYRGGWVYVGYKEPSRECWHVALDSETWEGIKNHILDEALQGIEYLVTSTGVRVSVESL